MDTSHQEATHSDILVAIASLREQLASMKQGLDRQGNEVDKACERLRQAENRIAQGMLLVFVLSIVMPILINMSNVRIHVGEPLPSELRR